MTSVESLTKALKDFAYAVPEDVRNAALAVVADLSAERKRREEAEMGLDEKSDMLETALSQRRATEQERDDALAAKERAEADNAALAEQLHHQWSTPDSPGVSTRSAGMLSVNHPGAAMLGRMRAMESLYDACAAYFVHAAANHDTGCPEDDTCECPHVVRVNDAFSAVDALKEKP